MNLRITAFTSLLLTSGSIFGYTSQFIDDSKKASSSMIEGKKEISGVSEAEKFSEIPSFSCQVLDGYAFLKSHPGPLNKTVKGQAGNIPFFAMQAIPSLKINVDFKPVPGRETGLASLYFHQYDASGARIDSTVKAFPFRAPGDLILSDPKNPIVRHPEATTFKVALHLAGFNGMVSLKESSLSFLGYERRDHSLDTWFSDDERRIQPTQFSSRILAANPWMSANVAAAWAQLAPNRNLFEKLIKNVDPDKAWSIQDRPGANLYTQPSPGDGDCFFWSIGKKRSEVTKFLMHSLFSPDVPEIQKNRYREMLGEGIFREAFQPERGLPEHMKTREFENTLKSYHISHTLRDTYIRTALPFLGLRTADRNPYTFDELVSHLYDDVQERDQAFAEQLAGWLINIREDIEKYEKMLRDWCKDPVQIKEFIKTVIGGKEYIDVQWGLAEILGEIQGFNVIIYEKQDDNTLKITLEHQVHPDYPTKHIFYNGQNHFDRLLQNPQPISLPGIIEAQGDWITMGGAPDPTLDLPEGLWYTSGNPVQKSLDELSSKIFYSKDIEEELLDLGGLQSADLAELEDGLEKRIEREFGDIEYGAPYDNRRIPWDLREILLEEGGTHYSSREEMRDKLKAKVLRQYENNPDNIALIHRMKELQAQKDQGEKKIQEQVTPLIILDHLMSTLVPSGVLSPNQIPVILSRLLAEDDLPVIKFSTKLSAEQRLEAIRKIETIQKQQTGMKYFVVTEDGTIQMEVDAKSPPKKLVAADQKGLEEYYINSPEPQHMGILDEIIDIVEKYSKEELSKEQKEQILSTVYTCKYLYDKRKTLLENPPQKLVSYYKGQEGGDYQYPYGSPPIHYEYSVKENFWYDVPLDQRLNLFHNAVIQTYLTAKKRGPDVLIDYFNHAYGGVCMDMRSNSLIDYAKKLEDVCDPRLNFSSLPKKGKNPGDPCAFDGIVGFVVKELERLRKPLTRKSAEELLNGILKSTKTKEGPLKPEDVKTCLDYAEGNYLIIYDVAQ